MFRKLINPFWAILEYLWHPLLFLAVTPYFLRYLGAEQFGLWMLLVAWVNFGAVLNVGTGAAAIRKVSSSLGKGNIAELRIAVSGSLAVALLGGCCMALVILAVFWLGGDIFFGRMGDRNMFHLTGTFAALLGWVEQVDNVFASSLKGAERFGITAFAEILSKTLQIIGVIIAIEFGWGLGGIYIALLITSLVRLATKTYIAWHVLDLQSLRPAFRGSGRLLQYSKWGWVQGMGGMLFGVADRILVGSLLGAVNLAHYSVASMLSQPIHSLVAAGLSVTFPIVSRRHASDPKFSLRNTTVQTILVNLAMTGSLCLFLWVFGERILLLWLSGTIPAEVLETFRYLVIAYFILSVNIAPHFILLGLGKIRFVAIANLVAGFSSLFAMVLAIQELGLVGAGVARVVYGIIICCNFVPLSHEIWRRYRGISESDVNGGV